MKKFMRTAAPPSQHNGHAHGAAGGGGGGSGGGGVRRDGRHSALSRYWSESEGSGGAEAGAKVGARARARAGSLYEDTWCPGAGRSLADRALTHGVRWMRPHELCSRPRYRGDTRLEPASPHADHSDHEEDLEPSRWSVEAVGGLGAGGAALCAAAAALELAPALLERAVPPHSFRHRYTGAFTFRFWEFGAWREVTVDDRLPTRGARLVGVVPARRDDFTAPLLHKAYAKLRGGYAALGGAGGAAGALRDLSGAVVQSFSLRTQPPTLTFQVLNSAVPRSTLLIATPTEESGRRSRGGLTPGHAYCVTGLARVRDAGSAGSAGGGAGALVRLRAVSGGARWAGAWAPHSEQWHALQPHDRELLAARAPHTHDFWMAFEDFAEAFASLELAHVGPDDWLREPALQARRPWRAVLARRRWRAGYNAGGPPPAPTAHTNPQFHVQVARTVHVVVSVTQQCEPRARRLRAVGFTVYEASADAGTGAGAEAGSLRGLRALDARHEARAREVASFFSLPAGRYVVVAHTARPHTDAAFLLRILTDEPADVWELNQDNAVLHDLAADFARDERNLPAEVRAAAAKLVQECGSDEVEAEGLRAMLRRVWRVCLVAAPSLELCRALVALRDAALAGCMRAGELPALLALLAAWRATFLRAAPRRCAAPAVSSYRLRALLWAAGLTASNKVLEGLVLRFARRRALSHEAYVLALARLHLAHERYRSFDAKMKSNPISLEEMILMTIYS